MQGYRFYTKMRSCFVILLRMGVFQKIIVGALFLTIGVISFGIIGRVTETPCTSTLYYSIESLDDRFKLSLDEFRTAINEAGSVWENPFDHDFFAYSAEAPFTINLIFDDRQQFTLDEQISRGILESKNVQQGQYLNEYEKITAQYRTEIKKYETELFAYERDLSKYNKLVNRWNDRGGAPPNIYNELREERLRLEELLEAVEVKQTNLNKLADNVNRVAKENNQFVEEYNASVITYNDKFGSSRVFDQGDYQGDRINIYQFESRSDLRLALAHELGHALTLQHIEDQEAIMYHLMDKQDLLDPSLTSSDMNALRERCRL